MITLEKFKTITVMRNVSKMSDHYDEPDYNPELFADILLIVFSELDEVYAHLGERLHDLREH